MDITTILMYLTASTTGTILLVAVSVLLALFYRIVVPTNEVHIVQSRNVTEPYGRGLNNGNVYYAWPSWVPKYGVTTITLPTSIFVIELIDYDAFDVGRVPFTIDVKAFFKVGRPEDAAQRVENFLVLKSQLGDILRGSVRKILASADIEEIMEGRGRFSDEFTKEVEEQLGAWGVSTVKNIEFMDIRDAKGSQVIENIMAKKKSRIEMESRIEVASNKQKSEQAEIDARKEVMLRDQDALRLVGEKTAEKDKAVGIAKELALQDIKEQEKITAEKELAVLRVQQEQQANINKNVAVIQAEQGREQVRLAAEGELIKQTKDAEGIKVVGEAKADAAKAMQMAPVTAQIALAKEIGANEGYQQYLLGTKGLDVGQVIGVEKAKAMASGDLKIIANAGDVDNGMTKIMDIFSAKGGTNLGSMLDALQQTDVGKALVEKLLAKKELLITQKS